MVVKKSGTLTLGKAKSCGCIKGTTKKYRTVAPNKGKRYIIKNEAEIFSSKKAWGEAAKLARGETCEACGWDEAACDVHHRVPRRDGGKNTIVNALVLCPNCHRIAHERGVDVIVQRINAKAASASAGTARRI